ncbi:MAG: HIT domain-containing protein [Candidatus Woesearchaeota archaeon]
MKKCVFCNLNKKEILIETEFCYVIADKYPLSKYHTLIIPKKHYESITQIPNKELFDIIKTIKKVEEKMISKLKIEGVDLRQNYRPFLKEGKLKKEHLHFHLIPRRYKDNLYKHQLKIRRARISQTELEEIKNVLG